MTASIARNTTYITLSSIGQKALAFIYFMFMARAIGVADTGLYFLTLSITTIFSVVTDIGVQPVLVREVAKDTSRALDFARSALGIKMISSVLAVLGVLISVYLLGYSEKILLPAVVAIFVMLADAISLTYFGVLRAFQSIKYEAIGLLIGQSIIFLVGGFFILFFPVLPMLIFALFLGSAFNSAYSAICVVKKIGTRALLPKFDIAMTKIILKLAWPFFLAGAFVKVYSYVDSILLSKFAGDAAVGLYAIAYKLTYSFQFIPMAFVAALYPAMSELVAKDKEKLKETFNDAMWYLAVVSVPICLGIWSIAPELVNAFVGSDYNASVRPLQILVFVLIPIFLDFPIGSLLNASGRQKTKTALMGATMVINILANVILIPKFGAVGAAYSALISFIFLFMSGFYFVNKIISYNSARFWIMISKTFACGIIMSLATLFLKQYVHFILVIPVSAVVYVVSLFIFKLLNKKHWRHFLIALRIKKNIYEADSFVNS